MVCIVVATASADSTEGCRFKPNQGTLWQKDDLYFCVQIKKLAFTCKDCDSSSNEIQNRS